MRRKITLQSVKALQPGEALYDTELKGFQVRRQAKATVYGVRRLVGRRNIQITIGEHGAWTPDKARKEAERLLRELGVGNDPRAAKMVGLTLAEAAPQFMDHIRQKRAASTAREYQGHLDEHLLPQFGRLPLDRIATAQVEKLHLSLKERKTLANRVVATLSSLYGWAEGKHVPRGFNPCGLVERFPEKAKERYLSEDELKRLGKALADCEAEGRWSPFALGAIRLLLFTGCRRDEIRLAQWQHVDWERCTLYLPKAKRGHRYVHLSELALAVLKSLKQITPDDGNPYVVRGTKPGEAHRNLQDVWEVVRERAELDDVRLHDLRHTVASVAGAEGASLPIIAALLGNTPAAAKRYTHVAGDPAKLALQRVSERLSGLLPTTR